MKLNSTVYSIVNALIR